MSSITRERIRCRESDCPWRDDEEFHEKAWCWKIPVEHSIAIQHQHWPKRSQGGKKVVALLCSYCHDRIDNGPWGNAVESGVYRIWDHRGNTLLRVSTTEAEMPERDVFSPMAVATVSVSVADAGATTAVGSGPPTVRDGEDGAEATSATSDTNEVLSSPSYNEQGRDSRDRAFSLDARAETPAPYRFLDNGIECESEITFEQAVEIAQKAASEGRGRQWKAGDSVNIIERFGERAAQYVDVDTFDYPEPTLSNFSNVAKAFPLDERRSLPWSYHQSVFKLPDRFKWLDKAIAGGWDRATLREKALGKKPKVRRWTISQLREKLEEYDGFDVNMEPYDQVATFVDWLEQDE